MAYDEGLAERIRELLSDEAGVSEKAMFGGLCFLLHGNMCLGIVKDELMVRVASGDTYDALLSRPHARKMDFTGRPMKGFLFVAPGGLENDRDLSGWVGHALTYSKSLPSKVAQPVREKREQSSARGRTKRAQGKQGAGSAPRHRTRR